MVAASLSLVLSPLETLLNIILQQYLFQSYCLTFISEEHLNFQTSVTFTYIEINGTDLNTLTDRILEVSEKGCSDYVVRVKEPKIFMEAIEKVTHLGNARRSDRKIIILPFNEDTESASTLLDILLMRETSFIANMLLILPAFDDPSGCTSYDLVTHKFVGSDEDTYKPEYLDRWNSCKQTFEKNANLFTHDMTKMQGKTLKVACFTYKPYALLDLADAPNGRDGTEMRIVEEFCRWINCTIKIVRADEDQWGEIYDNMTGIGVLGHVVEDRADLGISALYSWYEMYLFLDFSAASIRTLITCIAPAPRLIVSWEMPLMPFSWNMWIGMVLTFVLSSLAVIIAQRGSSDKAFLMTFGMLTAQSQESSGSSWRIRSITGWLLIAGLVLCNAYGAGLASTFTVPKFEKPINTIQDMVDTETEWGATHDAWIFSLTLSQEPLIKQLVKQFTIYSAEELKRKSFTRSLAFSIEKLPAGNFAIGEYITPEAVLDLQLMLEDFYYEQNVVMLRKSSPYTNKVSELIGRLHESGLLLAFETQVALSHLDYKVQLEVKLSRAKKDVESEPLNFRHVLGVFYIYGIGIACSLLLFIFEHNKYRQQNNMQNMNIQDIRLYSR